MADRRLGKGESLQVRALLVAGVALGLLILLAAIAFGTALFFPDRIGVRFVQRHPFPSPAVIPNERAERMALESRQRRALKGAGGRMPIEQAMRAVAAKGRQAFDPSGP